MRLGIADVGETEGARVQQPAVLRGDRQDDDAEEKRENSEHADKLEQLGRAGKEYPDQTSSGASHRKPVITKRRPNF